MKTATKIILGCLKRQRSVLLTKQHFLDLLDDIETLGRSRFLEIIEDELLSRSSRGGATGSHTANSLLDRMTRYRKQTGLSSANFNIALSKKLAPQTGSPPAKSTLASAPKYLAHLEKTLSATEIEKGFADVAAEYA